MKRHEYRILAVLCVGLLIGSTTAYTTQVTVTRYSVDGITPTDSVVTKTYQQMESTMSVQGDGNTYYYFQGPVFQGEWETNYGITFPSYRTDWGGTPPAWNTSEEKWDRYWNAATQSYDQNEEVNWQTKNLGKLKGTDVKDLCNLVGGLPSGQKVRVIAADNVYQELPYSAIYTPNAHLGPYVITWWSVGAGEGGSATNGYTGPDYTNGMRATFFSDNSRNPSEEHVAGLGDQAEGIPEAFWYYFGDKYPSIGGWTLKYVDRIFVYSNDPVPPPVTDFSANTKTRHIVNGNFETQLLTPWTGNGGATVHTGSATYRKGNASVKIAATVGNPAWIQQNVDLTDVGSMNVWRYSFGGPGKYLEVLVDSTVVANYTETTTVPNKYETIDISSYAFTGTHTLKFHAVSATSGTFTVYLDDIEDYGPGTTGPSPLTVQFKDLSTKMQDSAHTSWSWTFGDGGTSTERNPVHTYSGSGTYTVSLMATNAGGSDTETKTGYITAIGTPTISIDATGGISGWDLAPGDNDDTTSVDLAITTNANNWHVSVKDGLNDGKPTGSEGKMAEYTGSSYVSGGRVLTNALQVKSGSGSHVTLSGSDQTVQSGTSSGTFNYDIGLKQVIAAADPALTAPNVYRAVITFTGSTD